MQLKPVLGLLPVAVYGYPRYLRAVATIAAPETELELFAVALVWGWNCWHEMCRYLYSSYMNSKSFRDSVWRLTHLPPGLLPFRYSVPN
jgi:hypothetical protein